MSDIHQINPSDDSGDELELRLSAIALPSANLNRDEIMYEAGWAAANQSLLSAGDPSGIPQVTVASRTQAFWKLGTLVSTSAALIFAAMLFAGTEPSGSDRVASAPTRSEKMAQSTQQQPNPNGSPNGAEQIVDQATPPVGPAADPLGLINEWPAGVPMRSSMVAMSQVTIRPVPGIRSPRNLDSRPDALNPLRSFDRSTLLDQLERKASF